MKPLIIAIDGYSSCGKSTLAKALAKRLGYAYMDTGAMYRAVTLYFMQRNVQVDELSESELNRHLDQIEIAFHYQEDKEQSDTYLNGENVEEIIRGKAVSDQVSWLSQIKGIRKRMVDLQQKAGFHKSLVIDGRDIGTVVFPKADLKLFMTADPEIRAMRRFKEMESKGMKPDLDEVRKNLADRDYNDTHRKENPLLQAKDARVLDNSALNQEQQLDLVLQWIESKFGKI